VRSIGEWAGPARSQQLRPGGRAAHPQNAVLSAPSSVLARRSVRPSVRQSRRDHTRRLWHHHGARCSSVVWQSARRRHPDWLTYRKLERLFLPASQSVRVVRLSCVKNCNNATSLAFHSRGALFVNFDQFFSGQIFFVKVSELIVVWGSVTCMCLCTLLE